MLNRVLPSKSQISKSNMTSSFPKLFENVTEIFTFPTKKEILLYNHKATHIYIFLPTDPQTPVLPMVPIVPSAAKDQSRSEP